MRLIIPFVMIILFLIYVLYLALIKKELRKNQYAVLYPGMFFMAVWGVIYYVLIQ